jgi:nucleoside-diphosphate-sugar epimerase
MKYKLNIFITGSSGFVGTNFLNYFEDKYYFKKYNKNTEILIQEDAVLHFAGKAHDLKNTINPNEYFEINSDLTKEIFNTFVKSSAEVFIFLSSIKVYSNINMLNVTEDFPTNPDSFYGKSKLLAEDYILNTKIPDNKRFYILRPSLILGKKHKGNIELLYNFIKKGYPWPLTAFNNRRSYCYIENLFYVIDKLINNKEIPSGIYNVCDDIPISTNQLIDLISKSTNQKLYMLYIPKFIIKTLAKFGDIFKLPFNSFTVQKITDSFVINNNKIKAALKSELPYSTQDGILKINKNF